MGVVARKTFSHTPDEAMSDGLAKACGLGKMYSVKENISHFKNKRGRKHTTTLAPSAPRNIVGGNNSCDTLIPRIVEDSWYDLIKAFSNVGERL